MAVATLGQWGNATAVRIPSPYCEELGFMPGKQVIMVVEDNRLVIRHADEEFTLEGRSAAWDDGFYRGEELDWGEPEGDELW